MTLTTDPLMKFVPFTVSVNAPEPAVTVAGCKEVRVGIGFDETEVMVNIAALDVPPLDGFVTVTGTVPAVVTAVAGMAAVS